MQLLLYNIAIHNSPGEIRLYIPAAERARVGIPQFSAVKHSTAWAGRDWCCAADQAALHRSTCNGEFLLLDGWRGNQVRSNVYA